MKKEAKDDYFSEIYSNAYWVKCWARLPSGLRDFGDEDGCVPAGESGFMSKKEAKRWAKDFVTRHPDTFARIHKVVGGYGGDI